VHDEKRTNWDGEGQRQPAPDPAPPPEVCMRNCPMNFGSGTGHTVRFSACYDLLGIDRVRIGSEQDTRGRFLASFTLMIAFISVMNAFISLMNA